MARPRTHETEDFNCALLAETFGSSGSEPLCSTPNQLSKVEEQKHKLVAHVGTKKQAGYTFWNPLPGVKSSKLGPVLSSGLQKGAANLGASGFAQRGSPPNKGMTRLRPSYRLRPPLSHWENARCILSLPQNACLICFICSGSRGVGHGTKSMPLGGLILGDVSIQFGEGIKLLQGSGCNSLQGSIHLELHGEICWRSDECHPILGGGLPGRC